MSMPHDFVLLASAPLSPSRVFGRAVKRHNPHYNDIFGNNTLRKDGFPLSSLPLFRGGVIHGSSTHSRTDENS
jgi:hypothetical protein